MDKKIKVITIVAGTVVALALVWYFVFAGGWGEPEYIGEMTLPECFMRGGREVNTLAATPEESETCGENEKDIGSITGLMCPCICCVPK